MQATTDPIAFLAKILPEQGPYILAVKRPGKPMFNAFAATIAELWEKQAEWNARGAAVYHACASFRQALHDPRGTKAKDRVLGRTHHNVVAVRSLWLDVDAGPSEPSKPLKPYANAAEAARAVLAFAGTAGLPVPMLVGSGNGIHAYWPLEHSLTPNEWWTLATGLKALCAAHGLQADPTRTADMSSVLRTPGTHNRKYGEQLVKCFQLVPAYPSSVLAHLEQHARRAAQAPAKLALPAHLQGRITRDLLEHADVGGFGVPADKVADHCAQLAAMRATRGIMPEPLWYSCLGVLAFCSDGADKAHAWSSGYAGYTADETSEKYGRARGLTGATTCEHFHGLEPAACEACPLWGKIKSPISAPRGVVEVPPAKVNGAHALPEGLADPAQTNPPLFIRFPDTDKGGHPRVTCANTRVAIEGLGIACRRDVFHERIEVGGHAIQQWAGELSDNAVQMVRYAIHKAFGFDPGIINAHDAAVQIALLHDYDPVLAYLEGLHWDGRPRLATWLADYLGAERSVLNAEIGRLCLVAAVRRVRVPGAKFDQITVLEGPEGTRKSAAIEIMAGADNFSDQTILALDDRAQQEAVKGVWLYEIADLAGISKTEVEKVKAFASRKVDRARPAYGRTRVDRPRRCVFFATTNSDTYLKSQTGNRRFWPVRTGRIDADALSRDRDQLWAEAFQIEKTASDLFMRETLWGDVGALQDSRREHDPWDDLLDAVIGKKHMNAYGDEYRITSRDLMELTLKLPAERQNEVAAKRLAFIMRRLGWDGPKSLKTDSGVIRGYTREAR